MAATKKERELRREAVRRILMDDKTEPLKDQGSLVELLEAMGIPATQASVSRDLRELGAVWVDGHYEIPIYEDAGEDPLERVLCYIVVAKPTPPCHILIVTHPGAGPVVAKAVEACLGKDIIGTVAGCDSVHVLTMGGFFQDLVFDRLKDYFEPADEEEAKPSPGNGEPEPLREKP